MDPARRLLGTFLPALLLTVSAPHDVARAASPAVDLATTVVTSHVHDADSHYPLTVVGLAPGQTARINVTNSPHPQGAAPPAAIDVELMFHDSRGGLIVDRNGRAAQTTVSIAPHRSASLELNGTSVAAPGGRVTIIPCIKVVSAGGGSLAIPSFEIYNTLLRTTTILTSGALRGFDPQPDPPSEVAFGNVSLTRGVTARLYVLNDQSSSEPVTVEITFHDDEENLLVDRIGQPARQVVTLDPGHTEFVDLNGNDLAAFGRRVGIVPCVKVLPSASGAHVSLALETFVNLTRQTLTLTNWHQPPDPAIPR
jgi:hypothetical protein